MKPIAQNTLLQNRYLIVHLIGKGGMGEVYLAIDQRLGSAVALKRTFYSDDEMLGNAFEREAKTLARLRHPVLTKVSDHFVENDTQFLVMEHISGEDLSKRLEINKKPFPVNWVLFWADQLLDALTYLHTHEPPIIHRDIKPQNLKLTAENNVVLLDFGLSKNTIGQTRISTSGSVVGYTPHYAPMEQIRGMGTDERSDIFSLSATLYQLLTNVIPADALTRADSILSGLPDPIEPLDELNPEISKELSDVILKGMSLSQDQRHPNARVMQKVLREAFAGLKKQPDQQSDKNQTAAEVPQSQMVTEVISYSELSDHSPAQVSVKSEVSQPVKSAFETAVNNKNSTAAQNFKADEPDYEATIRYEEEPVRFGEKQADIKTEVFNADSFSSISSAPQDNFSNPSSFEENKKVQEEEDFGQTENFSANDEFEAAKENFGKDEISFGTAENFSPDATLPLISYEKQLDEQISTPANAAFDTSFDDDFQNETTGLSQTRNYSESDLADSIPAATPAAQTKSSSKNLLIAGGIGVFLFLLLGVAGLGWYAVTLSKNTATQQTPMPTPQEAIEVVPTPEPTIENVLETNADTADETSTNSNSDTLSNSNTEIVEQTANKEVRSTKDQPTPVKTPAPKQTTRVASEKTPPAQPEKTPAAKKTPVKSDRTDILQ